MKQPAGRCLINPDDPRFANPEKMVETIQDYCRETGQYVPQGYAEVCRCIFDSLVARYKEVFGWLKELAPFEIDTLHIIGGGSANKFLNKMTEEALGVKVIAGPAECTAIGNIMMQAKAAGLVKDVWEMRKMVGELVES